MKLVPQYIYTQHAYTTRSMISFVYVTMMSLSDQLGLVVL